MSRIPLLPFKIWLTVVLISSISYSVYIAYKYIFPSKGLFDRQTHVVFFSEIYTAIVVFAGGNNILKAIYTVWFGKKENTLDSFLWLLMFEIATIPFGFFIKI